VKYPASICLFGAWVRWLLLSTPLTVSGSAMCYLCSRAASAIEWQRDILPGSRKLRDRASTCLIEAGVLLSMHQTIACLVVTAFPCLAPLLGCHPLLVRVTTEGCLHDATMFSLSSDVSHLNSAPLKPPLLNVYALFFGNCHFFAISVCHQHHCVPEPQSHMYSTLILPQVDDSTISNSRRSGVMRGKCSNRSMLGPKWAIVSTHHLAHPHLYPGRKAICSNRNYPFLYQ